MANAEGRGIDLSISVNVSAASIGTYDLMGAISSTIAASGMPLDRLEVEITESHKLEQTESARDLLCALPGLGCAYRAG